MAGAGHGCLQQKEEVGSAHSIRVVVFIFFSSSLFVISQKAAGAPANASG